MGAPKRMCLKGGKQHFAFCGVGIKDLARVPGFGGAPSNDVNSENIYHTTRRGVLGFSLYYPSLV